MAYEPSLRGNGRRVLSVAVLLLLLVDHLAFATTLAPTATTRERIQAIIQESYDAGVELLCEFPAMGGFTQVISLQRHPLKKEGVFSWPVLHWLIPEGKGLVGSPYHIRSESVSKARRHPFRYPVTTTRILELGTDSTDIRLQIDRVKKGLRTQTRVRADWVGPERLGQSYFPAETTNCPIDR